ncbi:MAG: hypothetical protein R3D59_09125 [Paracoccaceae bacterium]
MVARELPGLADVEPAPPSRVRYSFDRLPPDFQCPHALPRRIFRCEDGALVLTGRGSLGSGSNRPWSRAAREHHRYAAECWLDFEPENYQQAAGLTTYYNRSKLHALMLSREPGWDGR